MPIYMQYAGVNGDVTEQSHKNWIELKSFRWGVGRSLSTKVGSAADRESSAPSVSEIVVTKDNDVASGNLMQEALGGHGKTVQIDFVRTDKGQLDNYLTLSLTDTIISGYSHSAQGTDRPTESLSLNFVKVEFKTQQMTPEGTTGQPSSVIYDLSTAKVG